MKKIISFLIILLFLTGCSTQPQEQESEKVTFHLITIISGESLNGEQTLTFEKGEKYDLSEYLVSTLSYDENKTAWFSNIYGSIMGIADKEETIVITYTPAMVEDNFPLLGLWKVKSSDNFYQFKSDGTGSSGLTAGTVYAFNYCINQNSQTIYLIYSETLESQNNYIVEEFTYSINDTGELSLCSEDYILVLTPTDSIESGNPK